MGSVDTVNREASVSKDTHRLYNLLHFVTKKE